MMEACNLGLCQCADVRAIVNEDIVSKPLLMAFSSNMESSGLA
jgi:hypothetical protein